MKCSSRNAQDWEVGGDRKVFRRDGSVKNIKTLNTQALATSRQMYFAKKFNTSGEVDVFGVRKLEPTPEKGHET